GVEAGGAEDAEGGRTRLIGRNLAACEQRAGTALDIVHASADVSTGPNHNIATTEFDEFAGVRRDVREREVSVLHASRHAGIGGSDGIDIDDIVSGDQGDIATAQGADALEEIAVVDPPGRGRRGISNRLRPGAGIGDSEKSGGGIDVISAVEPVVGAL